MYINPKDIDNWFSYHAPTKTQVIQYGEIRTAAKIFAETINKHVPAGADKTAAMRELRGCVMAANLAIACYVKPSRPTIAELEAILQQHEDDKPVTIHGDGSITADRRRTHLVPPFLTHLNSQPKAAATLGLIG